jgi:hypothetical protein
MVGMPTNYFGKKKNMNKTYYFIVDYNTKYGVVKKGESLTGRLSKAGREPKVIFDFFEKSDPAKAEAGEGVFVISQRGLKNFISESPLNEVKVLAEKTDEKTDEKTKVITKGWKSFSKTKKTTIIGSGLAVLGLAVWYFVIRKK